MTPQGRVFTQRIAGELSGEERLLVLCGHYRGVDDRLRSRYIDDEISIGDYVLSGGELPSLVLIEAVVRQVPGVLGNEMSAAGDSFASSLLEGPVFTRPFDFRGDAVPEVLLSGNAAKIQRWRRKEMLRRTLERRPDLLKDIELSEEDQTLFDEVNCERDDLRAAEEGG
jgi:tRNA (guanine37-N1)-methyltransferase